MNGDTLFLERISTIKKRVFIRTVHRIVVTALVIFLCLYAMATVIEKMGIFPFREYMSFYGLSLVMSLILTWVYVYVTQEGFIQILIDIDTRLQLKDRISTAYEYHKGDKQSEFTNLLIEDAGHKLSELSTRQLFPRKLSLVHLLLGLLIVANILLFFADYFRIFPVSNQTKVDRETSKKISALLQNRTKKTEESKKAKKKRQKPVYKKMEDIAKKLDEQEMTQTELQKSVDNMLKEVQGTKAQLTKELDSKLLDLNNIGNLPIREIPQLRRLSSNDLRQLRERLKEMFDNQIPESLEYALDRLEEQQELEELLERIRAEIESDNGTTSDEEQETAQSENDSEEEGEADTNNHTGDNQDPSDSEQGEDGENASGADFGWERGRGLNGESEDPYGQLDGDEGDSSVGHGRGDGTRQSPYEMERSERSIVQDKMISTPKDEFNVHIRALTTIGDSTLPEEDITRPYQQEVEEILQKEDIPLNYREYIKNYFISIGLTQPRRHEE